MIQVEHLTKKYGDRTAVQDIGFKIEKGEVIGFLGPNGAGKTTTLRMLTGYLAPDEGQIKIDGIDVIADSIRARRHIGYMPESVPLYSELRVEEYLSYRARLKGVPRPQQKARISSAMEMAQVAEVRGRIIGQLSRGYRSRVGLADALVAQPPVLILDEPTAGLDPNQIRQVRNLIRDMAGKTTVILSTHILPEVEYTCGRVLIIHEGRLVGEGTPGDLRVQGVSGQQITVEARGDREQVLAVLARVEGVRKVVESSVLQPDPVNPLVRARLETEANPSIAEAIFSAAASAGFVLRELRRDKTSLEDVFASLTTEEASHTDADSESVNLPQPVSEQGEKS
jgi:ABC-2 type transport system ATP-binding protein